MSKPSSPHQARARIALILGMSAILGTALAIGSFYLQRTITGEKVVTGKVLAGFGADMPQVRSIAISTKDGTSTLLRRGTGWVMAERNNYPVAPAALSQLAKGLSDMSYKAARTSDPSQFERLGVDEPVPQSGGAAITIRGGTNQVLHRLFIGERPDAVFVRKAGSNDVFEATFDTLASIPELSKAAIWLDLKVVEIAPETILSVSGRGADGGNYDIVRRPDGGFAPVGGSANVTATTAAIALTKWAPLDVMAANDLSIDPIATHVTSLRSGLIISATAYQQDGRNWMVLSADTQSEDQRDAATKLNQRTDGWAFELSALDFADLAFTKQAIIEGPSSNGQSSNGQ